MKTVIHGDNIEKKEHWWDKRDRLDDGEVYRFHLDNGFRPQLKPSGNRLVDFRKNEYLVEFRDGDLILYKKVSDSSELEKLSTIQKIMVSE